MKKLRLILAGTIAASLVQLTSCMYIGLPGEKVKRHNEAIKQQLPDFSLENFSGSFYNLPESEGKTIYFSSEKGNREYLIQTNETLTYFDGTTEKTYIVSTKVEESTSGNTADYQSIGNDIQDILNLVHYYNGTYDKITGTSGSQKYGEEIYDEIEHDVYSMEWKYSPIASFRFYLNTETSVLHSVCLRDVSESMNDEKPHFDIFIYPNESFISSLEHEYEMRKEVS